MPTTGNTVKGHQDTKADCPLTTAEHYNIECNCLAKMFVNAVPIPSTTMATPAFWEAQPHLQIEGKMICHCFIPTLQEQAMRPAYHKYLCQKLQCNKADLNKIYWEAFRLTLRSFPMNNQWHIILFLNNKLPLQASKVHPHPRSQLCPSCQCEPEYSRHFFKCDHIDRWQLFETLHCNLTKIATKYIHMCTTFVGFNAHQSCTSHTVAGHLLHSQAVHWGLAKSWPSHYIQQIKYQGMNVAHWRLITFLSIHLGTLWYASTTPYYGMYDIAKHQMGLWLSHAEDHIYTNIRA